MVSQRKEVNNKLLIQANVYNELTLLYNIITNLTH